MIYGVESWSFLLFSTISFEKRQLRRQRTQWLSSRFEFYTFIYLYLVLFRSFPFLYRHRQTIVPRITEAEMTGASCQNEKKEAHAQQVPRYFLLSECLFLIIKHHGGERNAHTEIVDYRLINLISSSPFVKPTRAHVCLLNVRFQNTIINGVKKDSYSVY